ncbi:type I restriction enzyme subunit R domain-containing protein [Pseudomonas sp.]|uniref:type I restriction enzyme subunit R domain-containing protein n=1 Tax=Pseudomonas sp. TaxID=306 RepID=UPI003BB6B0C2
MKAQLLQASIGTEQHDDFNSFDDALKAASKQQGFALDAKDKKQLTDAMSWKNPAAAKVIKKIHKTPANPLYGLFAVNGEVQEYQTDSELRDNENVALEAVRYKLCFDKYIVDQGYQKIHAMVAFSGEVEFVEKDPNSVALLGNKYTESNMNPNLKGRDMRKAFDSDDYQVMIVANKFQTGFDQPKLCAMYVDKKLGGVECVQTLSRLNRTYPGKAEVGTFILDFFNEPQEILDSFQPYFQTAELADVSNPDLIFDLFEKLNELFVTDELTNKDMVNYPPNAVGKAH